MGTLSIIKRKDEAAHDEYRMKCMIVEMYDAMQQSAISGQSYHTRLDPWVAYRVSITVAEVASHG